MTALQALSSLPAPSGGAVRLTLHSSAEDLYALVLASDHPTPPDPTYQDGARKVHGGKLRYRQPQPFFRQAPHAFVLLDLDSDALADGEVVYYHAFELHPDGTFGPPLTISAQPRCAREAAVTIARDIVKKRLRYHLRRAVNEGVVRQDYEIPVLEQEVRAEGHGFPAVYVKERVTANPGADTVGHHAGEYVDAHHPLGVKEYRFEYRASVDLLLLCDNPDERTDLEAFLRGALDADREIWLAAGLENPTLSAFTRHDVDDAAAVDLYGSEISLECGITTRITETITQSRPATVTR
ncbi:hypothetical protein [Deinococcus geothermalis]|nr:hypothetical protein [Deinococcus geothermalis]